MTPMTKPAQTSQPDARAEANIRELHRDFERAVRIPAELVIEESETASHGKHAWAEARA